MAEKTYKNLNKEQIITLTYQGCVAQDWTKVKVTDGFDTAHVRNVQFFGNVLLGKFSGSIKQAYGLVKPSGIYDATIADCTIGDDARISNIGVHIANYNIGDRACIENVGMMQTSADATFGNGVEITVLNEAGGREVIIFDNISAQFAYLMCVYRYRPELIKKLTEIAKKEVEKARSDRGTVGAGAQILSIKEIIDLNVGPATLIKGAASLVNGTILSSEQAQTTIGLNVMAKDFIIAEGSSVNDGVILQKTYIGQGCKVGKQFSAENTLFFANCEAFHGEACSLFAGPYSVTHHKSTLLIACLLSFYNAGSGSNQSNHMYKLGPAHEGKMERGTKTGSFSYMMWPCRVGPFSVVLGKHTRTFDTSDFPFTHHEAEPNGKCMIIPGMHLTTVGTVRDGAKWVTRDRRKGSKRDIISFDVFSPYTIGKMIKASKYLKNLFETTDRAVDEVTINGAQMKRVLLRTSVKFYRTGIEMYLLEKIMTRGQKALSGGLKKIQQAFAADKQASYSYEWVDICGQLMSKKRMLDTVESIEAGKIADYNSFSNEMEKINQSYEIDEWAWVVNAYKDVFGKDLESVTKEDLSQTAESYRATRTKFLKQILVDAEKEFDALSRTGFGYDGSEADLEKDFLQVRGRYDDNKFVKDLRQSVETVERSMMEFKEKISKL